MRTACTASVTRDDREQEPRPAAIVVDALVEGRSGSLTRIRRSSGSTRRSSGRAERAKKRNAEDDVPKTKTPSSHRYALTS